MSILTGGSDGQLAKWHRPPCKALWMPYTKDINARHPMRLQTSATTVDFYPVGTGKRFVKRIIWHPTEELSQMTAFSTCLRSDVIDDINQYMAHGATVTDLNLEPYVGSDDSPVYC